MCACYYYYFWSASASPPQHNYHLTATRRRAAKIAHSARQISHLHQKRVQRKEAGYLHFKWKHLKKNPRPWLLLIESCRRRCNQGVTKKRNEICIYFRSVTNFSRVRHLCVYIQGKRFASPAPQADGNVCLFDCLSNKKITHCESAA